MGQNNSSITRSFHRLRNSIRRDGHAISTNNDEKRIITINIGPQPEQIYIKYVSVPANILGYHFYRNFFLNNFENIQIYFFFVLLYFK